jgi:hypothetical protein
LIDDAESYGDSTSHSSQVQYLKQHTYHIVQ